MCACPGGSGLVCVWAGGCRFPVDGFDENGSGLCCYDYENQRVGRVAGVHKGAEAEVRIVCASSTERPPPPGPAGHFVALVMRSVSEWEETMESIHWMACLSIINTVANLGLCPARFGGVGFTRDRVAAFPVHIRGHSRPSGAVGVKGYEDNIGP